MIRASFVAAFFVPVFFFTAVGFSQRAPNSVKKAPASKSKVAAALASDDIPSSEKKSVPDLFKALRERTKKFHWDQSIFTSEGWSVHGYSINGMPLIYWTCGKKESANSSMVISAVHGDEVTPVSFGFRLVEWVKARPEYCKDRLVIVAPMVNPDGFLRYTTGTRTNFNKVDINRNMETPDWKANALKMWETNFEKQRRYFPGEVAGSEPETQFQQWLISEFEPSKILSVHAPLNIMDYDGPVEADAVAFTKRYIDSCEELKSKVKIATPDLRFFAYGNFPGSLGNYAGVQRGIPTLTAELPTAKPDEAAYYFGALEKGTSLFFDYELKDRPVKVAQKRPSQ
jgi:protein MpaA